MMKTWLVGSLVLALAAPAMAAERRGSDQEDQGSYTPLKRLEGQGSGTAVNEGAVKPEDRGPQGIPGLEAVVETNENLSQEAKERIKAALERARSKKKKIEDPIVPPPRYKDGATENAPPAVSAPAAPAATITRPVDASRFRAEPVPGPISTIVNPGPKTRPGDPIIWPRPPVE